jgi:cytoskeletal protein CcmA (bactofilin family)
VPILDNNTSKPPIPAPDKSGLSFSQRIFGHQSYGSGQKANADLAVSSGRIGKAVTVKLGGMVVGLVLFAILMLGGVFVLNYYQKKSQKTPVGVSPQNINVSDLPKNNGVLNLGDSGQTLTINSTTTFNDTLSVKKDIVVGGQLELGNGLKATKLVVTGPTALTSLTTSGPVTLQGGLSVTGAVTINGNTSVTGNGTFSGDVSGNNIIARSSFYSGNLVISGHITTSGSTPGIAVNASTMGPGATATIVGNDNAGTITIKAGQYPSLAPSGGSMATITFRTPYTAAGPRVSLTPVGPAAAELMHYVVHNNNSFTVGYTCRLYYNAASSFPAPDYPDAGIRCEHIPSNTYGEYSFDYQVMQ